MNTCIIIPHETFTFPVVWFWMHKETVDNVEIGNSILLFYNTGNEHNK